MAGRYQGVEGPGDRPIAVLEEVPEGACGFRRKGGTVQVPELGRLGEPWGQRALGEMPLGPLGPLTDQRRVDADCVGGVAPVQHGRRGVVGNGPSAGYHEVAPCIVHYQVPGHLL